MNINSYFKLIKKGMIKMKKYVLLFIICITSFGLMSFTNSKFVDPAIIISKNITKFNEEVIGGERRNLLFQDAIYSTCL